MTVFLLSFYIGLKAQDTIPARVDRMVWSQYLHKKLTYHLDTLSGVPPGIYRVKLKIPVSKTGTIATPVIVSDPGFGFASVAVKIILRYPGNWYPATVKGTAIDYDLMQEITFNHSGE